MNREVAIGGASSYPLVGDVQSQAGNTNVTVVGLQHVPVSGAAPADEDVLTYVAADNSWEPTPLPIATTSSLGVVEADGTTITVTSGGIISAVGGGGAPTFVTNPQGTAITFSGWVHQFGISTSVAMGVPLTTINLSFPVPFTTIPSVICQPNANPDSSYGTAVFSCYASNVTLTGFTANLTCGVTIGGTGPSDITNTVAVQWQADATP